MKQLSTLMVLLLLLSNFLMAQIYSDTTWERWYGEANRHEAPWQYNHIKHYDNGLLNLTILDQNPYETSINKTDVNGFLLWEKLFDTSSNVYIASLSETSDGGILGCGSYEIDKGYSKPLIVKLNACGELEWCNKVSLSGYSFSIDIDEDKNGDYIALVYYLDDYQNNRCQLYKFNSEGNVLWHHSYASKDNYPLIESLEIMGLDISEDNSYYLSGRCLMPENNDPNGAFKYRPTIIKVNQNGEEEWVLPFGVYEGINGIGWPKIFELAPGHFVRFISELDLDLGGALKFDEDGNVESCQFNPFLEEETHYNGISSIIRIGDNKFSGVYNFYFPDNLGYTERGLITFDDEVNILAYSLDEEFIFPFGTFKSHDNKFMNIATWPNAQGTEFSDVYMAKYNEDLSFADTINDSNWTYDSLCPDAIENGYIQLFCDVIGLDEDIHSNKHFNIEVQASPNPAQEYIEIKIEEVNLIEPLSIEIFDISGRICYQGNVKDAKRVEQVNIADWESGMYLVSIKSAGVIIGSSKFVKQ